MSPVTTLSSVTPLRLNACSGHHSMHFGSPPHISQTIAFLLSGCMVIAPYWHVWIHQPHPSHLLSSTTIVPFSTDCFKASLGHTATHGASLQALQVTAKTESGLSLTARILDLIGLKVFSFSREQMYSQMSHPTHFSGLQLTNCLTVFKA